MKESLSQSELVYEEPQKDEICAGLLKRDHAESLAMFILTNQGDYSTLELHTLTEEILGGLTDAESV